MAWKHFFTGATPEKLEARGDRLMASGQWGPAKLAFERALVKLENTPEAERRRRVERKIAQAREALAREHRDTALSYLEGGYVREARECLQLALDVTRDPELGSQLTEALVALDASEAPPRDAIRIDEATDALVEDMHEDAPTATAQEQFEALCNTLPEDVAAAYRGYGEDFMAGYLALNRSDFEDAVVLLERAMAAAAGEDTYIPLELATAYLNLGRAAEARELLETFHRDHPDVLPACELLCTIHWESGDFDQAEALLKALPAALSKSRAGCLLKGETLLRAGRHEAARDFYRDFLAAYGWDAAVAQSLAQANEALNETAEALRIYREIIEHGRSCRSSVDPQIRHHFAELAFAQGERGEALLELYLTLAKDLPARAATYFERISRIYAARDNPLESERFRAFARRARAERNNGTPS